VKEY